MPVKTEIFSRYELALFQMVLRVLKGKKARTVSSLTHQLRLWKELRDSEEIPLDYFALSDDEVRLIEDFGFFLSTDSSGSSVPASPPFPMTSQRRSILLPVSGSERWKRSSTISSCAIRYLPLRCSMTHTLHGTTPSGPPSG